MIRLLLVQISENPTPDIQGLSPLYQGIYVDPKRDVVGVHFSTSPVTGDADILMG